jgi:hypothetical protein
MGNLLGENNIVIDTINKQKWLYDIEGLMGDHGLLTVCTVVNTFKSFGEMCSFPLQDRRISQ